MGAHFFFDRLFRRERLDRSMEEELRFHITERAAELRGSGLPAGEAERRAQLEFGGMESYKEQCRETRVFHGLHGFFSDLRFGWRMLRRRPGFALLAILCLTLGIGANAAVFSWIEGTLLRPYPLVPHQERLRVLGGTARGTPGFDDVSWPDLLDLRRGCTMLDSIIAEKIVGATLSVGDRAERTIGSMVSANYFDALGVHPILGRGFRPDEDSGRNAHPVIVISYQFWKDHFHGDPGVIGKTQTLNSLPHTIVGVAPQGFFGTFVGYAWQFWVPVSMQERFDSNGYQLEDRGARWIEGFVRLKPGVTAEQAQQEIAAVAKRLENQYPTTNRGRGITLLPLWESPFNGAGILLPTLGTTLAVVFMVLLIACANVSNLLLVRSLARRHEMTVRMAVGASRVRLFKQLVAEGLILSAFAAAGGILVAHWCRNLLVLLMPPRGIPLYVPGEIDWRVMVFSVGVCLVSTLLCGLVPAVQASRIDVAGALKCDSGAVISGGAGSWIRSTLVVVQVSLSFVLLVGAGLLIQSLQRIRTASPGFSTQGVLTTAVNLFASGYDAQRAKTFQDQLIERVDALGGVQSAAYARILPFSNRSYNSAPIAVDGYQTAPDEQPEVAYNEVSPGYFATMGIPTVSGREFTRNDDETAPLVAVVNQTMAAQYWKGADPVGKRVQVKDRWMQVVGVAKNSKYRNMVEMSQPFFYVALRQNFSTQVGIIIRTRLDAESLARAVAHEVHTLDPGLGLYEVITMREQVDRQAWSQQIAGMLLGMFGGLALLLATIGLYGVMSYAVSQSTRELGLRMALGAAPSHLLRLVMSRGLVLSATGVMLGAAAALASTRLLGYLLYNVSPRDTLSFGSALLVVIVASLAACFLPAWRATRTDPLRALRD